MKKIIIVIISIPVLIILILAVNYIIFINTVNQVSGGEPIAQMDTIKQALMVIDIQEGTTGNYSDNKYYMKKSEEIINTVNILADYSYENQIPVIYVKTVIHNFLLNILNDIYAPESLGSKLDSRLNLVSDIIFEKDKADAFHNSVLDSFLTKNEINKLVFTGLDLEGCVNYTILAADNRNYDICLISDAVLAKSDSLKEVKLNEFKQRGYEIISSDEYFNIIHK
jgi:nicotinamidase-related amidase